jgi:hypothetical protein
MLARAFTPRASTLRWARRSLLTPRRYSWLGTPSHLRRREHFESINLVIKKGKTHYVDGQGHMPAMFSLLQHRAVFDYQTMRPKRVLWAGGRRRKTLPPPTKPFGSQDSPSRSVSGFSTLSHWPRDCRFTGRVGHDSRQA